MLIETTLQRALTQYERGHNAYIITRGGELINLEKLINDCLIVLADFGSDNNDGLYIPGEYFAESKIPDLNTRHTWQAVDIPVLFDGEFIAPAPPIPEPDSKETAPSENQNAEGRLQDACGAEAIDDINIDMESDPEHEEWFKPKEINMSKDPAEPEPEEIPLSAEDKLIKEVWEKWHGGCYMDDIAASLGISYQKVANIVSEKIKTVDNREYRC